MWIERKDGLAGPARIGRVTFSKSRKSLHYDGKTFHTLAGRGFKTNYVDVETGEVEKVGQASGGGNLDVLLRLVRLAVADLLRTGAPAGDAAEPEQT